MRSPVADVEVIVGEDPNDGDTSVTLTEDALARGCYVTGGVQDQQTALLQDWCVQWAEAGLGFCYVHPRGPDPRDLLARLPEDRLDDVVWLDFRRTKVPDQFDVPAFKRVGLDPFEGPERMIDTSALVSDPIGARTTDFVAACYERYSGVDWNVARILTTVLPWVFGDGEPTRRDLSPALSKVRLDETVEPLLDLAPNSDDPTARTHLEHALAIDPIAFVTARQCLGWPLDPFPSNPLLGETTYPLHRALTEQRIVLVTGALPPADIPPLQRDADRLGTHLLVSNVIHRLWEAAQTDAATPMFPLVLDGVTELVPEPGVRFREILNHGEDTPLALVARGPPRDDLPEPMGVPVSEHVDTRVVQAGQGIPGIRGTFQSGDLTAAERYLEREQSGVIGEGPLWRVRTGTARSPAVDPPAKGQSRPAVSQEPPAPRRNQDGVADAITRSIEQYGADPSWLPSGMKREARSG